MKGQSDELKAELSQCGAKAKLSEKELKDTAARINKVLVHGMHPAPAVLLCLVHETLRCQTSGAILIGGETDPIDGLSGLVKYMKSKIRDSIGSDVDSLIEDANQKVR